MIVVPMVCMCMHCMLCAKLWRGIVYTVPTVEKLYGWIQ